MSWGDLYLYMIQSIAGKRSIVRTGFLWKRWSGRQAATWVVLDAPHEVVTLGYWVCAQGALDIKEFYKNRRQLLLFRRFKINDNNCPQHLLLKRAKSEETRSAVQEPPRNRTYLRRKTPTLSWLLYNRSPQRSVQRHAT